MKRIILHWTAGTHRVSPTDKKHYHFVIDGEGQVYSGTFPISANAKIEGSAYAAHTRGANTGAIGIAVAAMHGAVERPFNAGKHPITKAQVDAMVRLARGMAEQHGIPVTRETVLTHAEVQPTLGIAQRGKWDITWLPGMATPGNPVDVGDYLRGLIAPKPATAPQRPAQPHPAPTAPLAQKPATGLLALILRVLAAIFGRK